MKLLRDLLKEGTAPIHDRLEEGLGLIQNISTLEDYVQLLKKMYGFYFPLEKRFLQHPSWLDPELEMIKRMKANKIQEDLLALGTDPLLVNCIPLCDSMPVLHHYEDFLGCLYVLEGSTLGGQFLKNQFESKFGIDKKSGCAFFTGYAEDTRKMWNRFVSFLNTQGTRINPDAVLASAIRTFESLEYWMARKPS